MTREQAKELLPVIQAFAEGKTVQVKAGIKLGGSWCDISTQGFSFDPLWQYRVKPEPRRIWKNRYGDYWGGGVFDSPEDARNAAELNCKATEIAVEFVEVVK